MDGWTESAPLSGACSGDTQINEDLELGSWRRLDNQAPRSSRFKGGAVRGAQPHSLGGQS